MTDLVSTVVTLRASEDTPLPRNAGRAVYALFMRWLEAHDAELAKQLHDSSDIKPYTCSDLVGIRRVGDVRLLPAGQTAWFRITALTTSVAEMLLAHENCAPKSVDIDGKSLEIVSITSDAQAHKWAGRTTYHQLAAPYLMAQAEPSRQIVLTFVSPTTFKQNDLNQPLALPTLVFGSLAEKWELFSPIVLQPNLREFAKFAMTIGRFSLKSRLVMLQEGVMVNGAIGYAAYRALHYDRYWLSILAMLAEYAFYSGVGRYTSLGMGRVRQQVVE